MCLREETVFKETLMAICLLIQSVKFKHALYVLSHLSCFDFEIQEKTSLILA